MASLFAALDHDARDLYTNVEYLGHGGPYEIVRYTIAERTDVLLVIAGDKEAVELSCKRGETDLDGVGVKRGEKVILFVGGRESGVFPKGLTICPRSGTDVGSELIDSDFDGLYDQKLQGKNVFERQGAPRWVLIEESGVPVVPQRD